MAGLVQTIKARLDDASKSQLKADFAKGRGRSAATR
jgi:hypothetical protein